MSCALLTQVHLYSCNSSMSHSVMKLTALVHVNSTVPWGCVLGLKRRVEAHLLLLTRTSLLWAGADIVIPINSLCVQ